MRQLKINKSITNREDKSLETYLQEIGREGMVNEQQEVELAKRIKLGDQWALEKLTKANLRFVVSVAKQYQNQGLSLPDLINEGNLGLIKAAVRFDETRGFKFISYAVWWIRQSIMKALAEQAKIVRLPINKLGQKNKIAKAVSKFENTFEREPTDKELSDILGISEESIQDMRNNVGTNLKDSVSMDAPILLLEGEGTMHDTIPSRDPPTDRGTMNESLRMEISRSLATLTLREREVLELWYGIKGGREHTLEEIGAKFDLTKERVRQIKEKAIRRLKHPSRSKLLKPYLGN